MAYVTDELVQALRLKLAAALSNFNMALEQAEGPVEAEADLALGAITPTWEIAGRKIELLVLAIGEAEKLQHR